MARFIVPDRLDVVTVQLCQNDRECWYRVTSLYRYRGLCVSELSVSLARRILPRWFDSMGMEECDKAGMFAGIVYCPRITSWACKPR